MSPQPFQREVRLGLVLYGGVSLAVYMNGVANEFFDVVKGRGPYKLLKALTDSDVVVDIVSGTSAGGINGVLLSYALSNDRAFGACGTFWREAGDIESLLREPSSSPPRSLLRGETYFQDQLETIFRQMPIYRPEDPARTWESPTEAIDLFVTGTDYDGGLTTTLDSLSHGIDVKDHRRVFKLKFRAQAASAGAQPLVRRNDLGVEWDPGSGRTRASQRDEERVKALATVSRITASFPAAFSPTPVAATGVAGSVEMGAASLLREWGQFEPGRDRWFIDGGVLNNKPFSTTIRDIYLRTSERRVKRKLFYVDPDPERFGAERPPTEPGVVDVVLAALVGLPGYQSISGDLREVEERNARVKRYWEIVDALRRNTADRGFARPSTTQNNLYLQARIAELRDAFVQSLTEPASRGRISELDQLAQRVSDLLLTEFRDLSDAAREDILAGLDAGYSMRRLFHVTYFLYDRLYDADRGDSADRERTLLLLYALNRQLQVLKVVQWSIAELRDAISLVGPADRSGEAARLAEQFRRLPEGRQREVALGLWSYVGALFQSLLEVGPGDEIAAWLTAAYGTLPAGGADWKTWLPDQATAASSGASIDALREKLGARVRSLRERAGGLGKVFQDLVGRPAVGSPAVAAGPVSMLIELERASSRVLEAFFPPEHAVSVSYHDFRDIDASLFPLEYLSDLREKDHIDIVRVSPADAQLGFSRKTLNEKLAGDAFFHFGAFFKRSWRSNDILWGRLDTVDLLFECILDGEGIGLASGSADARQKACLRITGKSAPERADWIGAIQGLFPRSGQDVHERIADWLSKLMSEVKAERDSACQALTGSCRLDAGGILDVMVRAAQGEVVESMVPEVVKDAVGQSLKWETFKPLLSKNTPFYEHADVDQLAGGVIKAVADDMLAREGPPALSGTPAPTWSTFFESSRYRVGSEQMGVDIPTAIVARLLSQTLLVAKQILFGELQSRTGRRLPAAVRLFGSLLSGLLWTVYGISRIAMTRQTTAAVNVAVFVGSLVLLAIGMFWASSIWWVKEADGRHVHVLWLAVFVIGPLLLLAGQYMYLGARFRARSERGAWRAIASASIAALIVIAVLVGYISGQYAWVATASAAVGAALESTWALAFVIGPIGLAGLLFLVRRFTARPGGRAT